MAKTIKDMRPVYVIGIGLDRYQRYSERSYIEFGLIAIRAALADAGIPWPEIESFYLGTAMMGMGPGRAMIKHLGATGIPITQVENASASGSTSFRQACLDVASGLTDISMAAGVDKPALIPRADGGSPGDLIGKMLAPVHHFALLADQYREQYGVTPEQLAAVAVKNHSNGSKNPFAQRQKIRTLEEVMAPPYLSGPLNRLHCCPIGEGAAAVIVASEDAMERLKLPTKRSIRVMASASRSERLYEPGENWDVALTRETTEQAYREAGITANQLDVVELHDAFTIEEIIYTEAMGLSEEGNGGRDIAAGEFDIGGRCALSPSGGLLSMGHPIGPTGVGQIAEVVRQLRGEAGDRQQPGANTGLTHMVGIGAVCLVHILQCA